MTARTMTVSAWTVTEDFQVPGCHLEATHGITENANGRFGLAAGRHFTFTPAGCTLPVTAQGVTYQAGPAYSSEFQDSNDGSEEIAYVVTAAAGGYTLTSAPELNGIWGPYGCAATDQIVLAVHTLP